MAYIVENKNIGIEASKWDGVNSVIKESYDITSLIPE